MYIYIYVDIYIYVYIYIFPLCSTKAGAEKLVWVGLLSKSEARFRDCEWNSSPISVIAFDFDCKLFQLQTFRHPSLMHKIRR